MPKHADFFLYAPLFFMKRTKGSSITRVLEIIDLVAHATYPLSAATIAESLDIPRPSVHRLLQQLADEKYLESNLAGHWLPAPQLRNMSLGILNNARFRAGHNAILQRLASHIGETCGLSIPSLSGVHMTYLDRAQTNWPLQINVPMGSEVSVTCTASGKLYLASLPLSERERLLRNLPLPRLTRNTITDLQQLSSELKHISQTGIGTDNEEFIEGMVACAVPILDDQQRFLASLFVHAPTVRISLAELLEHIPILQAAATELYHSDFSLNN